MNIIFDIAGLRKKIPNPVATLGMFDGVHLGHQKVIECVNHFAAEKQGESVVITFDRHPKSITENRPASFITSLNHRLSLLERLGVDNAVVLGFDQKLAQMAAGDFIKEIMVERLGVKCVVLGFNCRFGKNREGNSALVNTLAAQYGFEVHGCPPVAYKEQVISSTAIRQAILEGDLENAAGMLGRPVSIIGTVVKKAGRGRTLGYPTANLNLHHEVRPPRGVYGAMAYWSGQWHPALTNIGMRPTFAKETPVSESETMEIEVHIVNFQENLYGCDLEVQFLFKIRNEMSFETAEELKVQIEKDKAALLKRMPGV